MRKLKSIPIILSSLIVFHFQSEAQLLDTISKNHYCEKEIFNEQYLDIYNSWMLKNISGGLSGEGYDADFDKILIDSIGIFKTYRNDSLFIYGKITLVDQTDEQLLISFDADTVSGGIFFDDMYKYIDISNDTLMLIAPCCDRYNYLFIRESQIVYIPDTVFLHALIDQGVDTDEDSLISPGEAEAITNLNVALAEIHDMTGIEKFINLDTWYCYNNPITSLDVSNCTALKCLDVSDYTALRKVDCGGNQLASLNVSGCTALTELYCSGNELTDLDASGCINLTELSCINNQLISLDISNIARLERLDCYGNQLSTLELSNYPALAEVDCKDNQLSSLIFSENAALERVECENNELTNLDVSNSAALLYLDCSNNELTYLNITGCNYLYRLECSDNRLDSLDVSSCTFLDYLDCSWNQLSRLDLANHLQTLNCGMNQLTSLDVSNNTALELLVLNFNENLHEVCVWTMPFPPIGVSVQSLYSPNICFETDCNGACSSTWIDFPMLEGLSIYPIPTNDRLTIETTQPGPHFIEITSMNGQLLYTDKIEGPTHQIDLSSFEKGLYFLTIRSRDFV